MGLSRTITFFEAVSLGLGALIGAGIFVLVGPAMVVAGPWTVVVYVLAGLSALLSALAYSELSTTYLDASGEYALAKRVSSQRFAFWIGWMMMTGSTVACAIYALGLGAFLSTLVPLPIWILALGAVALVAWVNIVGAHKTAVLELYITVFLGVSLLILGSGFFVGSNGVLPELPWSQGLWYDLFRGVGIIYVSFFGFQVIAASSKEIKNPTQVLPRAMLASTIIALIIYVVVVGGVLSVTGGVVGRDPAILLAMVGQKVYGSVGEWMIYILAILATITSLNATVLAVSRRIFTLAEDRFIPELLARVHPKFGTPHLALLFLAVMVSAVVMGGSIEWAANLSAFCYLVSLVCMHVVLLLSHKRHKDVERPFRVWFHPLVPMVGIVVNVLVLLSLAPSTIGTGIWWGGIGLVLYELLRRRARGMERLRLFQERVLLRLRGWQERRKH